VGRAEDVRWHLRKDDSRFWALGVVTPMHDADDRLTGFSKILRDMTESKNAERELQKARSEAESLVLERTAELRAANAGLIGQFIEKRQIAEALDKEREFFKAVLENAQDGIVACDSNGAVTFFNRAAREFHGKAKQPLPAENWLPELDLYHVDGKTRLAKEEIPLYRALQGEVVRDVEIVISPAQGVARTMQTTARAIMDASGNRLGAVVVLHDVTERNLLERQLRQSQRMDAFGQLAGGIAHDFNNLLTLISGYSELVLTSLPAGDRNRDPIWQIHQAGERAALLTRQLLTFSRKQVVQPQVLDLNAVVASTEKMLGRLIGEDIALKAVVANGLSPVKADPGQIEQVIMNLVVNARDAMPQGGSITIETANIDLDASYSKTHTEVKPGHYVMLAVSDTGCGMTEEIMKHAFEPFFTTKEVGQGTGIGLATVFGIVKQSGGHIWLYSEVGHGTTFKIYLPAVEDKAASTRLSAIPAPALNGSETILIVEDEEAVRRLTRVGLVTYGYTVLEATDVQHAITICKDRPGIIHLLISDVVMPGMGGRQLAKLITDLRPNMRVLFVSGYTDDAVVRHGVLEADVAFLQKPFSMEKLCRRVRTLLDGAA
jgi:PAS domain S-box-containing protein